MAMLRDVLAQPTPYPAGLTWVRRPEDKLTPEVGDLLAAARAAGVEPVHEVEASGMMELMAEIERAVDLPPAVAAHLAVHRPAPLRYPAPPPSGPAGDYPQVRLAALPLLSVPDQARLLEDPAGLPLRTLRQALRAGEGPRDAGPPGRRPARRVRRRRRARRGAGRARRAGNRHRGADRPGQGRRGTRQHRPGAHRRDAGPGAGPDPRHHRGAAHRAASPAPRPGRGSPPPGRHRRPGRAARGRRRPGDRPPDRPGRGPAALGRGRDAGRRLAGRHLAAAVRPGDLGPAQLHRPARRA